MIPNPEEFNDIYIVESMGILPRFLCKKNKVSPQQKLSDLLRLLNDLQGFSLVFFRDEYYKYNFEKIVNTYCKYSDNFWKLYNLVNCERKDNIMAAKHKFNKINAIFFANLYNLVTSTHLRPKNTIFKNKNVEYVKNKLYQIYDLKL